jgi:hypothetical protein
MHIAHRLALAGTLLLLTQTGCAELLQGLAQQGQPANYGANCATAADCTGGTQCLDTGRTSGKKCVASAAGPAGAQCVSAYECQKELRCSLRTGTCERGGMGLPECDSNDDCGTGRICRDASCIQP